MKCSMHLKLVAVAALLVSVLLAGSAWAGETEARAAITAYGLTAGNTGNTIDVTGSVTNATQTLDLGDISGLVINWAATLEVPEPSPRSRT